MNKQDHLNIIKEDFINCQKVLLAIGDETRQSILLVLMGTDCQTGLRVGEITGPGFLSPWSALGPVLFRPSNIMFLHSLVNFYTINFIKILYYIK
jgi:hypothetical protein